MNKVFDFNTFPILTTERLRLRQLTHDDADAIMALYSDPEVVRYITVDQPFATREEAVTMIDWLNAFFDKHDGVRWAITLPGEDVLIGTCGFHYWSRENRRTDIGYDLRTPYWGRGYMTEVGRALVTWCFENLNLHRVQADCTDGNMGSQRVLEKLGFTFEGLWRESCLEHGQFVSLRQYGLLRREWEAWDK